MPHQRTSRAISSQGLPSAAQTPSFSGIGSGVNVGIFFAAMREIAVGPSLGASAGDWQIDGVGTSPATVTLTTQASGSTIITLTAAELAKIDPPTYNGGAAQTLLEANPGYAGGLWPGYGYELYGQTGISGGAGHALSAVKPVSPAQESTLIGVEVRDASNIIDTSIVARAAAGAGVAATSASVTVTGPALLLSTWSGDGGVTTVDQTATVPDEWCIVEALFLGLTAYIQTAVAVRLVEAGTYTCDWTPVENQGAILGMVALQGAGGGSALAVLRHQLTQQGIA